MNLPLALDWLAQGQCTQVVCLDTNRTFVLSKKGFYLIEPTPMLTVERPAILTEAEQSSQAWAVYRTTITADWLLALLKGKAITETRNGFRFVHQVRDNVVYSAKLDESILTFEDIRNWFYNKALTEVVFGSYEIE